jgi:protein-disulfide isomerase
MARLKIPASKNDHIQGSLDAPIVLVQYGDYQCPYCRMAYPVIKKIQKQMGDGLAFVYRNFPLSQVHPFAVIAAEAAEAASLQDNFWQMHDLLYDKQPELSPELIAELVKELHLDLAKFKKDATSEKVLNRIKEDFMNGVRSGVNGTPCFFINGERYNGAPTFEELKGAIAQYA